MGLALALAAPSSAQQTADPPTASDRRSDSEGDQTILEAPALSEIPITKGIRIRFPTLFAPDASIGSGEVSLVRPEFNLRGTLPVSDVAALRMTLRLSEHRYRFDGDVWGPPAQLPPSVGLDPDEWIGDLDLHSAQLRFEGAVRLSNDTHWLAKNEEWGAIGALFIGSRWENDRFHSGLGAGGGIGIGYELPDRLRLALGVTLKTPLDDADIDVGPLVSLRWRPVDRFTLRTRELGLQAEYVVTPVLEVFIAGFRSSDRFRLADRDPLGDLSFLDRQIRVGAGFEWRLANWLRLVAEGGSIVHRRIRITEEDLGTLISRSGDPSGYCEVTLELRL